MITTLGAVNMIEQLSFEDYKRLAENAKRVRIYREISADRLTPIGIVERLSAEMNDGVILESGLSHSDAGRYSFIAFGSMAQLKVENKVVHIRLGDKISTHQLPPFDLLRELIFDLSVAEKKQPEYTSTGAVGFLSYDAVRLFEAIPDRHSSEQDLPEMVFNFYETTLTYDHLKQKLLISKIVLVDENLEKIYDQAQIQIDQLIEKISANIEIEDAQKDHQTKLVETDIDDEKFINLVERAKNYIVAGDAFQIVLSRSFKKPYTRPPFDIYRALRQVSPSPYMFYFPIGDRIIVGASPEKLISVRDGQVDINPIAGTRRRGDTLNDAEIVQELLNDPKEIAEHMMLVDLARNDLGAVCEPGSVKVTELSKIKHFSHVSHIASVVTGKLAKNKDAFDALQAAFPAGTLSGAPKIRAMEIIDELETSRRGMYGGAICRLDYDGNFDSCIAIRMALLKDGLATIRTGAGIVYDSHPPSEANETRLKAAAILEAINLAERGLS